MAKTFCNGDERNEKLLDVLYRRSGIDERRFVLADSPKDNGAGRFFSSYTEEAPGGPGTNERMARYIAEATPLSYAAAEKALVEADVYPDQVTHLVTVSCTGFDSPGVDIKLIKSLGLPPTVKRTNIGFMGCHGALNGLQVAESICKSDPGARVLLSATELCSLHMQYGWNPNQITANALFADGSAAAVLSSDESPGIELAATGSRMIPDSLDDMTWKIGDHGFEMHLSARVPGLIASHLRPWIDDWLSEHGCSVDRMGSWAIHPGGPRILQAVQESLGLSHSDIESSMTILRNFGNMSSPTVLIVLKHLLENGGEMPCLMLAFGPGLVAEAALLR